MRAITIPIAELSPDPANARRHPTHNLDAIKASLRRFGQQKPIVIDQANVVRAGNGLLEAAKAIGWTEISVVRTELSGAEATAFAIADNRTAELAEWDLEVLGAQLEALQTEGFGLEELGFDEDELEQLLGMTETEGRTDPDEVPEEPDAADVYVKPGELYLLGKHRLLCGDSTKSEDVARVLDGERAAICWTDPPWNVAYGKSNHPTYKKRQIANDDLGEAFPGFCAAFCASIKAATKAGAPLYMAMSAQEWPVIDAALRHVGFHWSSTIIWAKDSLVLGRGDYHRQYEPLWYGWQTGAARLHPVEDRKQSDLWEIARPKRSDEHPTMKPVELITRALANSSARGDVVFEPFSGSGSTVIAAEQTGRRCCAIELEPKYVQVAIERWQQFTGAEARRA